MKGDPKVIEALNEILTGELTAINQYFLHARMCKNWGYEKLAAVIHKESIDEMKHAQELTDRILFLDGLPNFQRLGKLSIGETVSEVFAADLKLEFTAIPMLKNAIKLCYDTADHGSRDLLETILCEEEKHVDWLETQIRLVTELGAVAYLAEQL